MAESSRINAGNVVCPFYYYSTCRDGMSCKYILDATCDNIGNIACEYFLKGICKNGDECLFNHTIITEDVTSKNEQTSEPSAKLDMELCPHFFDGVCPYDECPCLHGEICELCRKYCLNPFDEKQRSLHIEVCGHEQSKNLRDFDKTCGICLDVVIDKNPVAERRFGIRIAITCFAYPVS
nr:E3 ubiquitin-protein ligase makorin-1-like [Parasteatoda tepidariorum]